jgi:ligand-binding SRPBCC domain-containing protein
MKFAFQCASQLNAPVQQVWESVSTMQGVNDELRPLVRMTFPETANHIGDVPLGKRAFRSVILLLGIIPFDVHDLTLIKFEPGQGFYEHSSSLMQRDWIHERTLQAHESGCIVSDHVQFLPRLSFLGHIMLPVFQLVFRNRHRNLRLKFGGQSV